MGDFQEDYAKLSALAAAEFEALRFPEPLPLWAFAEKHVNIPGSMSAKSGRYSASFAPYQREPQESFFDPEVQVTVLCWPSRMGKTQIVMNGIIYNIQYDPTGQLIFYPTLDSAEKWSKQFLQPVIDANPALYDLIGGKSRDSGNTILTKRYPGGKLDAIGANSPSGFRQIQASFIFGDEIDAMGDLEKEGDPVSLAFRRADNHENTIQILSSTPTVTGMSRIWDWLSRSDFRKWFVPCRACGWGPEGKGQVLTWGTHVRILHDDPRQAFVICEHCGKDHDDRQRVEMVRAGVWRATQEFTGIRGYWLSGLNSVFGAKKGYTGRLHQWATERLAAEKAFAAGQRGQLQTITNTFDCETYEDPGTEVRWEPLYLGREVYDPTKVLPEAVLMLTCAVDTQGDRLELELIGWGAGEECWGIAYIILPGKTKLKGVWDALDGVLSRRWMHPLLGPMGISACAIDSGGHSTPMVYEFVKKRECRHVFAVRGAPVMNKPLLSRPAKSSVRKVSLYEVGTDTAKSIWYERFHAESGPGFCHFPALEGETESKTLKCNVAREGYGYDQEYFEQVTAERRVVLQVGMIRRAVWKKTRDRNEALDIRVYNLAALEYCRTKRYMNLEKLQKHLEKKASAANEPRPRLVVNPVTATLDPPTGDPLPLPERNTAATPAKKRWRSRKIGGRGGM